MGAQTLFGTESLSDTVQVTDIRGQAGAGNGNYHVAARFMGKEIFALAFGRQPDLSTVRSSEKKDCFNDKRSCTGKEPADKMCGQFRVFLAGFPNGHHWKRGGVSAMQRWFLAYDGFERTGRNACAGFDDRGTM